jgi:hypothetical protein
VVQLTGRDQAILRDVLRFGALTCAQLTRRHFGATWTAYHRLALLVGAGYLEHARVLYGAPGVYVATSRGAAVAEAELPAVRPTPMFLAHHLAVADLADWLLARHVGASWVTERELRQEAMRVVRQQSHGRLAGGTTHVPDGLLLLPHEPTADDVMRRTRPPQAQSMVTVAVELEVTSKKERDYERILRWYGGALTYRQVTWFCTTEAVRRRLASLVIRERLGDLVSVEALPAAVEVSSWGRTWGSS